MLTVIGTVVQNVVAEAMSTEVVSRRDAAGNTRPEDDVRSELGMVQVIGRLALSAGMLAVAGLSGWLASVLDRETVFLWGLVVPALSVIGVLLIKSETNGGRWTGAFSVVESRSAWRYSASRWDRCRLPRS